ncbi:cold-shock protein, partial [Vibrio cholerae]
NIKPLLIYNPFNSIASGGVKTLFEGQKVNFSIEQGSKGLQAVNVIPA